MKNSYRVHIAAMLLSKNKIFKLYKNRFNFTAEKDCIVPAIQHGCHASLPFCCLSIPIIKTERQSFW